MLEEIIKQKLAKGAKKRENFREKWPKKGDNTRNANLLANLGIFSHFEAKKWEMNKGIPKVSNRVYVDEYEEDIHICLDGSAIGGGVMRMACPAGGDGAGRRSVEPN